MDRREFSKIMGAVVAGMVAGAASAQDKPKTEAKAAEKKESNICKGKNDCKSKGNCKTPKHDCKGKNACKGQGGCAPGDGGCAGKNSCKGKGGCGVPVNPDHIKPKTEKK